MRLAIAALACSLCAAQIAIPVGYTCDINNGSSTFTLSAASHRVQWSFWAPANTTITSVLIRVTSVTTADTLRVGIYSVDASLNPVTLLGSSQQTVAAAGWYTYTMSVPITGGTLYSAVAEYPAYAGGNMTLELSRASTHMDGWSVRSYNGTSWNSWHDSSPVIVIVTSTGILRNGAIPCYRAGASSYTINANSTPDERGLACTFASPVLLRGAMHYGGNIASGDADIILYGGGGVLETVTALRNTSASFGWVYTRLTPRILQPGAEYILSFKPKTTTNATFLHWNLPSQLPAGYDTADVWLPQIGSGKCRAVYRTDGGAWTYDDGWVHGLKFVVEGR